MTFLLALLPGFLLLGLFTGGGAADNDEFDEDDSEETAAGGGGAAVMPSVLSQAAATDVGDQAIWDQDGWDQADDAPQPGDHTATDADFAAAFPPEPDDAADLAFAGDPFSDDALPGAAEPGFANNFNVLYQGMSTAPAMIDDFDAGSELIEIVLDQGISGGPLAAEASEDGADTAITMGGVPVVVLQGVNAADVDLSRVSVNRLS